MAFGPCLVFRLVLSIRRIQSWKWRATLYLTHDPSFQPFLLYRRCDHVIKHLFRNEYRAVLVDDDDVIWKYRDAAAVDGLLPSDKGKSGNRWWRGSPPAPYRQTRLENPGNVAYDAIRDQRRNTLPTHARAQDVAKNA